MKGIKFLYAVLLIILVVTMTACGIKMGKIDISFGQKNTSKVTPSSESRPIKSPVPIPNASPEKSANNISGGARMVKY